MAEKYHQYPELAAAVAGGKSLIAYLRGNSTEDMACLLNAEYAVQGYAQSMYPHDGAPHLEPMAGKPLDVLLEEAIGSVDEGLHAFPWGVLVPLLIELLLKLLKK